MTEEQNSEQPISTPGPMLSQAREQLGLSTQQVAQRLNLRHSVIQGIEQDVYEANMSITYIRGYIRNYARLVGLDEQQLNESLNAIHQSESTQDMLSFSGRTKREKSDSRWRLLTWGIAVLLIAALAWWAYSTQISEQKQLDLPKPTSLAEPMAQTEELRAAVKSEPQPIDVVAVNAVVTEPTTVVADEMVGESELMTPSEVATPAQVDGEPMSVETAISSDDQLVILLKADCWMLVEDADGNKLVEGLKLAGYTTEVRGATPYKIRLGAPEAVQLSYNGDAVDLSTYQAGKVARLTLPQ